MFAASASADAPLTQGFEDGAPGWSMTGMWHVQSHPEAIAVIPAINPELARLDGDGRLPAAYEGTNVAWFGEAATGTYCGADFATIKQTPGDGCTSTSVQRGELTSPSFSLVGRTTALLGFRAWWEIQAVRPDQTDLMGVEYSTDGGATWSRAATLNPPDTDAGGRHDGVTSGGWQSYSVDLSPAAGQSDVRVRFVFDTVDPFRNGFRGLLVDNVAVSDALGVPISEPGGTFTDSVPELSITGAQLFQGPDGSSFVHFTVVASHAVDHPLEFDWTLVGASGAVLASGHGTLPAGQTQVDFTVPVAGGDTPYTVNLSNPSGAVLAATASSATTGAVPQVGLPPVGNPVFKKSFGVGVVSGTVRYRRPGGRYVTLGAEAATLPLGSVVDATKGHALIAVESTAQHTVQQVEVWDGKTGIFQSGTPAIAELRLAGGNFSRCGTSSSTRARASRSPTIRRLWATGKGSFRTKGRYASATVRGTYWSTADLCNATRVTVKKGIVAVRDFRRHRTVNVPAGHSVTITALRTGRYRNRPGNNPPRLA